MKEEDKKIDRKNTFRNIKYTWKYAERNKRYLFIYFAFTIFLGIISAVVPLFIAKQFLYLMDYNVNELLKLTAIVFAIELLRNVFIYFANLTSQRFFRETLVDLQYHIAKNTIELETEVIDKNSSGVFIDRINKDSSDIADIFYWISHTISDFLSNIGVLVAVFIINKYMFLFFIVGLSILFIFKKIRMHQYFLRDKKYRELSEKNTGLITELVRGIRDIKLLNIKNNFINKVFSKLSESNKERYEMHKIARKYDFATGSTTDFLNLSFIILAVFLIDRGMITVSSTVIIYMYRNKLYAILDVGSRFLETVKKFNLSANRVFEIINGTKYSKEKFGSKKLDNAKGNFEFKKVSFRYDEEVAVIKDLSFKVSANETVAFVGKSGSGKTTIFNLLTKMYEINKGAILIDGVNIAELDRDSIRGSISIISQSPYVFNFSIKENLTIVKENLTEEEMVEVCKTACIHDFIMTLPKGYDTVVGEGGLMLSGGQRQRLAIARALIKKTEIILFDEATSSLDNETQKNIQKAIDNMRDEYTILIIAHRLSTIINSDRIIVIDDGKVIAEGNHKKLMKKNKIYKELYEKEIV